MYAVELGVDEEYFLLALACILFNSCPSILILVNFLSFMLGITSVHKSETKLLLYKYLCLVI